LVDYLASEQSLWFGHPSHPAPKARIWPEGLDEARFAPEFRQSLQLHLLEVPSAGLWIGANGITHAEALGALADQRQAQPDRSIIAMHPTQADLFLRDNRVMDLLHRGEVRDLGRSGYVAYPTASVRTLYIPDGNYFIKGSLNIRITNCVRKNAWYELESALVIDDVLARLVREQSATTGGLQPVPEPAAISWCPAQASEADRIWFREQTGVILRHNFCRQWGESTCVMAATLFGRTMELCPPVQDFIVRQGGSIAPNALLSWFKRYAEALLRPVLHLFFNHGLIFEPHLQNTVLIHRQGQPVDVLLRDYEGVKLSAELGMALAPADLHPRVRQSLEYSRARGWNRIAYCLFINNLSEAVLALSWRRPALAQLMWAQVRQTLEAIARELPVPTPELDGLLSDGLIPCKTNLKTRLAAVADRQAGYSWLQAPWAGAAKDPLDVLGLQRAFSAEIYS
jgi:siderophore synthetase component